MSSPGRSSKLQHNSGARRLVSIPEAREILGGIGHTMMYALINNGDVTMVKLGRRSFILSESIDRYIDSLNEVPA